MKDEERFMMKNQPPRKHGVFYTLGGRPGDPNEKPRNHKGFTLAECQGRIEQSDNQNYEMRTDNKQGKAFGLEN